MGSGNDSSKASGSSPNALTRLAHQHVEKGELELAMKHFVSAVERSKEAEDSSVKLSCLLNAGACLVSLGHYQQGLELLHSAADLTDDHVTSPPSTLEMRADILYNIAIASQGLKEYDKAVTSFKESIELYTQANSTQHTAESLVSLASCHKERGDSEGELVALGKAQEAYRELGECSGEALAAMDLAKACLRLGRVEEGRKCLGQAKMLCLRVDDPKIQGECVFNTACTPVSWNRRGTCTCVLCYYRYYLRHRKASLSVWSGVHISGTV